MLELLSSEIETIQRESVISFPGLFNLTLNPPSYITVFGRQIYFYGILIAAGFILGMLFCSRKCRKFGIKQDDMYDYFLWILPTAIIGARLYYVLFKLDYYLANPGEIIAVWNGGLAIYGGVIACVIVLIFVSRHKKIPVVTVMDVLVYGLLIGQIIGRWGNFMNREAFGAETDIFCRMGLTSPQGTTIYVHPTFLYESLWNLAGFIFLCVFLRKDRRSYDGQCALIYFFWYGLGRAWIEGLRTDSLYIGGTGIRVSQALSVALALVSAALLIINGRKKHRSEDMYVNRAAKADAPEASKETEGEN